MRDRALGQPGPDYPRRSAQLDVERSSDAYLRSGEFSVEGMVSYLSASVDAAVAQDFDLLRAAGEMSWVLSGPPGWGDLFAYESSLNSVVDEVPAILVCLYDLRKFGADMLVEVLRTHPKVLLDGTVIDNAFLQRRTLHADLGAGLRIIGSRYSDRTRALRDFASRNRVPCRWEDVEDDAEAEATLRAFHVAPDETPVVIWKGRTILRNPSTTQLAELIGLRAAPSRHSHDLVVVGAGPGGLAAAVYAASEGLSTVVLDALATGGQAATSSQIENYLGFPAGIAGAELADRAVVQARKFGAVFTIPGEATSVTRADGYHVVGLADGADVVAHTVLIATGVRYRRLDVPGVDRLERSSVYYAATEFEARLCRQDPVTVVGGGNSAGQAACFLARRSPVVDLVVRHDDLGRDMSRYLADRVLRSPRIRVWRDNEVCALVGERALEEVELRDLRTGEKRRLAAGAVFVLIGAAPHTGWLRGQLSLDANGYVCTGSPGLGHGGWFATSRPGVFAVGDVRSGSVKRVASAVGEGSVAIRQVHEFLQSGGRR